MAKQSNAPTPARRDDFNGFVVLLPAHIARRHRRPPFSAGQIQSLGGAALMSASAERLSRSMARSPRVTMPTAVSPWHTGTRRGELCRISSMACSTVSDGATVTSTSLDFPEADGRGGLALGDRPHHDVAAPTGRCG